MVAGCTELQKIYHNYSFAGYIAGVREMSMDRCVIYTVIVTVRDCPPHHAVHVTHKATVSMDVNWVTMVINAIKLTAVMNTVLYVM